MSRMETISAIMVVWNVIPICMTIIPIRKPFRCVGVGYIDDTLTSSLNVVLFSLLMIIRHLSGDMIFLLLTWCLEKLWVRIVNILLLVIATALLSDLEVPISTYNKTVANF